MFFRQIYDDKLAEAAYLIGCQRTGEAIVIDPERDIDRYEKVAKANGLRIVAVCRSPDAAAKLLAAGADKVVDPYEVSGARVHELIERPEVVELMEHTVFGLQDLNIAEVTIPIGSWLHGVRLSLLRKHMTQNVILLGVVDLERGKDMIFSARGIDHNLDYDDVLVVIGPRRDVAEFQAMVRNDSSPV